MIIFMKKKLYFVLFVVLVYGYNMGVKTCAQSQEYRFSTRQVNILMEIKNSLTDPSSLLDTWDPSTRECFLWHGLTCDSSAGLFKIDLSFGDFLGTIAPRVSWFRNLTYLSFRGNSLSGTIPASISDLTKLKYLDLSNNLLSGSLPANFGKLKKLTTLNISRNSINGSFPKIENLTSLRYLDISQNSIEGSFPKIENLTSLRHLNLTSNKFSGSIPTSIENLRNLTKLYLGYNFWSGEFPTTLTNLAKLTELGLSNGNFNGSLPSNIGNLKNLTTLKIDGNFFTGSNYSFLQNLKKITVLNISSNLLTGDVCFLVFPSCSLTQLYLQRNSFHGKISCFERCPNLSILQLGSNNFSGNLFTSFEKLKKLVVFNAEKNFLSGSLPFNFNAASGLKEFVVSENRLSGTLPSSLSSLKYLSKLYLDSNYLTGDVNLSFSDTLFELSIGDNFFSGSQKLVAKSVPCPSFKKNCMYGKIKSGSVQLSDCDSNSNYQRECYNCQQFCDLFQGGGACGGRGTCVFEEGNYRCRCFDNYKILNETAPFNLICVPAYLPLYSQIRVNKTHNGKKNGKTVSGNFLKKEITPEDCANDCYKKKSCKVFTFSSENNGTCIYFSTLGTNITDKPGTTMYYSSPFPSSNSFQLFLLF